MKEFEYYFWEKIDSSATNYRLNMSYDSYRELFNEAWSIAKIKHKGQKDRGGADYIEHPRRVAYRCWTGRQQAVALLHDVIEDTDYTLDDLRNNPIISKYPEVIEAVDAITKRDGESYSDFIERISNNGIALCVKIRDLEDNLDCTRLPKMKDNDWDRMKKYYDARAYLIQKYLEHYKAINTKRTSNMKERIIEDTPWGQITVRIAKDGKCEVFSKGSFLSFYEGKPSDDDKKIITYIESKMS